MRTWSILVVLAAACGGPAAPPRAPGPPSSGPSAAPRPAPRAISPDDPRHWTAQLGDPREAEHALDELEQLGDPSAIPAIGAATAGDPLRRLRVIVALARPLSPAEAHAQLLERYAAAGRPASWAAARPFLERAVAAIDEADPRSIDAARVAADALGEAGIAADALVALAQRPVSKRAIVAEIAAIRALGHCAGERAKAVTALVAIIDRPAPPSPREGADPAPFMQHLAETGAAINALGELRDPSAVEPLLRAMYHSPQLLMQARRALVACGAPAEAALRAVLRGRDPAIERLFAAEHLGRACDDSGACTAVSAKDGYAAIALGDFHDPASVPDLLAVLRRPPAPIYVEHGMPSDLTQQVAALDALQAIGAPAAAPALRTVWRDRHATPDARAHAVAAYGVVAPDGAAAPELWRIAADNDAADGLREEALTAFGRLSAKLADLPQLRALAQRYLDASAKKAREAARLKPAADAAEAAFVAARDAVAHQRDALERTLRDSSKTAAEIRAATEAVQRAQAALAAARKARADQRMPYRQADQAARDYVGYARMFQDETAAIELGARCKQDLACFAGALRATPDAVVAPVARYLADLPRWTDDDKRRLAATARDRALVELGRRGAAAAAYVPALLDALDADDATTRAAALAALPRIASRPCPACAARVKQVIHAHAGEAPGETSYNLALLLAYYAAP